MPNPTCPTNCDFDLPPVNFNKCNPIVPMSEIRRIFVAKVTAAPFTNWLNAAEWLTRLSQTSVTGNDYIRPLTVIADKPAAASVIKEISNGRRMPLGKDHTINVTIDDVSGENYELMRVFECGGQVRIWYETEGGYIYGGNEGVVADVDLNDVLNRGREESETLAGTITWRAKFHPERGISPIYDGNNSNPIPTVYDTTFEFGVSATPPAVAGITAVAAATDPEQKFEFNAITPRVGTPITFSIKVGGVEELTITGTTDYVGTYFRYTDKAGVTHTGQFIASGEVNF